MKFIKNIVKITLILIVLLLFTASMIPSMYTAKYIWPFSIPLAIIIAAYCITYDTDPITVIDRMLSSNEETK